MENTPSDKDLLAEGIGQVIGQLLGSFVDIVHALRQQPNFDDNAFRARIEALLANPAATQLQQHTYRLILQHPQNTPPANP